MCLRRISTIGFLLFNVTRSFFTVTAFALKFRPIRSFPVSPQRSRTFTGPMCTQATILPSSSTQTSLGAGGSIGPNPRIADADCNIFHPDLISLLPSSLPGSGGEYVNGDDDSCDHAALRLILHQSTRQANVQAVFVPSSTLDEADRASSILSSISTVEGLPQLRMGIGVHPYHTSPGESGDPSPENLDRFRSLLLLRPDVVSCIGECGLDYSEGFPNRSVQLPWFEAQCAIAAEFKLPLFVHERDASQDMLRILEAYNDSIPAVMIHCFTSSPEVCEEYAKRGYFFSVSGYVNRSDEGAEGVRRCLRDGIIPLERLTIETDAPYMGFRGCRDTFFDASSSVPGTNTIPTWYDKLPGKKKKKLRKAIYPNIPSSLPLVLETVTQCVDEGRVMRGEKSLGNHGVAEVLYQNFIEFFRFGEN